MFQRKPRRFRRRPNGRSHISHGGINDKTRLRNNSFTDGQPRNNFRTFLSAEKLFEKYSSLAKEAMSSGDKTLSENYLQHADHFMRIIGDRKNNQINKDQNKNDTTPTEKTEKPVQENIDSSVEKNTQEKK